ncbi:dihydrodipicolinate reductase [Nocardia halotolerans]|uniref:Dihydrodipicolinate reductase n=1 Tax=Nocardia halotolerans TaxID=1755878 RepID=A0ABV8VKB6_9NOCA
MKIHPPSPRALRVVQWATGNIGSQSLRAVIDHPRLTLSGLYVHTPGKVGRAAGELCGHDDATTVRATDDIDEVLSLGADCVLYMPRALDAAAVCRILASGTNIVTTSTAFHHPPSMDRELCARVEAACWAGGASLYSTGSSPGFITEAVPLALLSLQRRLGLLSIDEYADLTHRDSPAMLFDVMGFGRDPADFPTERAAHLGAGFGPSLRLLAEEMGTPLDSVTAHGEIAVARRTTEIAAGTVTAGTVGAQRVTVAGRRDGETLLSFRATWYCTRDLEADWELRDTGWHIEVDGDAPLDVDIRFPVPVERMASTFPAYTAHRAVNAVAAVCAAPTGIRTTTELPPFGAALA